MPDEFVGLTELEVRRRVERGDVNEVAPRSSRPALQILRANVLTRFNALLGTLFVVIVIVGPWQDALFGGVLIVNAVIGIVQELRAKWTLDRLAVVSQSKTRAVRAGRIVEIPAGEIVQDDLLELAAGDEVVVDGIIQSATGLEFDESLLTGESEAISRGVGDEILSGSFVVAGTGRYRVTRVGASTYAQDLAREAKRFKLAKSELRAGINRILRYVTWAIVPTAGLLFASQFVIRVPVREALLFSAAGVIAMVPEGLVLLTSLALAVGAVRLARQSALVQDLPATETLARVDVICLDKTGTLTEREPELERVELIEHRTGALPALAALAAIERNPNATLRAIGRAYHDDKPPAAIAAVPFSSARKWSGATFREGGTWVLGAPEVLLAARPDSEAVRHRVTEHARAGRRVLLLARTDDALSVDTLPTTLVPVALVLLVERVRADAAATLRYFDSQGIAIKVISGDHPGTVSHIVRQLGIADSTDPVDARTMPQGAQALAELVRTRSVFGRISPQQKEAVITSLQADGHIVAMVGDGVNDVLALKHADIGIAMGGAVAAARAISQIVLLNSRFANLPSAIAEGRRVVGNVERLATLFLTKTVYAMLLAFAVGVADITFPFLPRHLSLVGALTIGIPGFFLSLRPSAQRARPGFVQRALSFAVPAGLFVAGATFAAYVLVHTYLGGSLAEARTAATVVLFAVATYVLVIVAHPLKPARWLLLGGTVGTFASILAIPWFRALFALERLSAEAWFTVIGITLITAGVLHWSFVVIADLSSEAIKGRPVRAKAILAWLLSAESPKWFLFVAAVLIVGGSWLFFGVLEDVISHDPLVDVDVFIYHFLQHSRTPALDSVMVAITEIGDVQVLLPVILIALAWLIAHRLWLTAGYWLAAIGVAELLAKVLKLTLHRPRPGVFHGGMEQFSFPSGHSVMSVVVYGFLAFLLAREAPPGLRRRGVAMIAVLIALIAFSRLYLGAHWLSDVLGGLGFGVAWVAALATAYEYQSHERVRPQQFAAILLATAAIAGIAHIAMSHGIDVARYSGVVRQ